MLDGIEEGVLDRIWRYFRGSLVAIYGGVSHERKPSPVTWFGRLY